MFVKRDWDIEVANLAPRKKHLVIISHMDFIDRVLVDTHHFAYRLFEGISS